MDGWLFTTFSEREGFEPSVRIELVQRISNQPLSTTQPSLLCIEPFLNSIMCHHLSGFAPLRFAYANTPLFRKACLWRGRGLPCLPSVAEARLASVPYLRYASGAFLKKSLGQGFCFFKKAPHHTAFSQNLHTVGKERSGEQRQTVICSNVQNSSMFKKKITLALS